ncbi:peptidase S8 [Corallococcus interemptor]|uniref:Peptidase S8 n=1 Tax=Corallococcus interemptor TaxID=2316720 RepID=A0A3A8QA68_9BACT|nr:S8 family serine peptidase [Corallococcus interemptor]RKH61622.1 peptidase S8 [Corallococcus interemptor]
MKRLLSLGWAAATAAVLGCGTNTPQDEGSKAEEAPAVTSSSRSIVTAAAATPSACNALYASSATQAALSQAVVDPALHTDGSVRTLILSFNTANAAGGVLNLDAVLGGITRTLGGLTQGLGLGNVLALKSLPMVALKVPVTPKLITTLRQELQPLGLISIYEDKPLQYFLDTSVPYIHADTARTAYETTGAGIGVGVIDSGLDGTHGDFPNVARNVKVVASPLDVGIGGALYVDTPNSDLTSGHGTHCASIIAGSGARSGGRHQGVAPGAKLLGVGTGDAMSILFALEGFDFLLDPDVRETHNVRVISNSWGTSGSHFAPLDPIAIATKRAYDLGMVVVFAAGNEGSDPDTLNPYSASPCAISVAAGTSRDTTAATNPLLSQDTPGQLASFSSRGIPGDAFHHPDITLPGVNIVAARALTATIMQPYLGLDLLHPEPFYAASSGTSMAAPHMAGVAALLLEVNPALDMDGVLAAVQATARPMYTTDAAGNTRQLETWEVGAGYADVYAATKWVNDATGTRYTTQTTALPSWTGTVKTSINLPVLDLSLRAAQHEHTLSVPAGASALRIKTDWGNPAYDLDLYVFGPNGELVATSAEGTSTGEAVTISNPPAGTWRVQLKGFLNVATQYTGTAEVDRRVPRP